MTDQPAALEAMRRAIAQLTPTDTTTTTYTFAPPVAGHWCATCQDRTLVVADLLRIDGQGATAIASFRTCPQCCG